MRIITLRELYLKRKKVRKNLYKDDDYKKRKVLKRL